MNIIGYFDLLLAITFFGFGLLALILSRILAKLSALLDATSDDIRRRTPPPLPRRNVLP